MPLENVNNEAESRAESSSHSRSNISNTEKNDYQLMPIPSYVKKMNMSSNDMNHPPATPISIGNDSFSNADDDRKPEHRATELRNGNSKSSKKDFIIRSDAKVGRSEAQVGPDSAAFLPKTLTVTVTNSSFRDDREGDASILREKEKTVAASQRSILHEKVKVIAGSQPLSDENTKKERKTSKGQGSKPQIEAPESRLQIELNLMHDDDHEEEHEEVVDSADNLLPIANLSELNPDEAPRNINRITHEIKPDSKEKKGDKKKEHDGAPIFVDKKGLSILNLVKSRKAAERHETTPVSLSPKKRIASL